MFFGFSHAGQHSLKCWKCATSSDCSGYWSQRRAISSRHCCCPAPFICSGVWKSSFTYLHSDAVKGNIGVWQGNIGVWRRTQVFLLRVKGLTNMALLFMMMNENINLFTRAQAKVLIWFKWKKKSIFLYFVWNIVIFCISALHAINWLRLYFSHFFQWRITKSFTLSLNPCTACRYTAVQINNMILALDETKYEARMEFSANFGLGQLDMNNRILQEC